MIDSPTGGEYGFGFHPRENWETIGSLLGDGEWEVEYPNLSDNYRER
jgi:hypothetical protein